MPPAMAIDFVCDILRLLVEGGATEDGDASEEMGGVVKVMEEGGSDMIPDEVIRVSTDWLTVEDEGVEVVVSIPALLLRRFVAIGLILG